jgi:N-acetyl-alpha-D-muramate 1-phosphate uridylyltransferase
MNPLTPPHPEIGRYPIAILAGGLATRLRPVTERIPKSLVSVAGEPFLSHQFRLLHEQGLRKAVLCIGHLGEMIEQEYGRGAEWGMELSYSYDGATLQGTGGALARALPLLGDAFFVLYGDSYLPIDYAAVLRAFQASGKLALMTVFQNNGAFDRSNVLYRNGAIVRYDKHHPTPEMRYIDYGLSLFRAEAFAGRRGGEAFDLAELQHELVEAGEMAGHEVHERFYEIGSHQGLRELDRLLLYRGEDQHEPELSSRGEWLPAVS